MSLGGDMNISKRNVLCMVAAALAALFMTVTASAQVGDAEISGTITDPSGGPVAGAKVSLTNDKSGVNREVVADNEGRYRFPALAPGPYFLKTEAAGFRTESVTGI